MAVPVAGAVCSPYPIHDFHLILQYHAGSAGGKRTRGALPAKIPDFHYLSYAPRNPVLFCDSFALFPSSRATAFFYLPCPSSILPISIKRIKKIYEY